MDAEHARLQNLPFLNILQHVLRRFDGRLSHRQQRIHTVADDGDDNDHAEEAERVRAAIDADMAARSEAAAAGTPEPAAPAGAFIRSPLVGTYYAAPGEGSEPYVTAGSSVKKGETVCIVEAMKMMNEVVAPCNCIIEEVLKENATAAGFDEPLFRIREI